MHTKAGWRSPVTGAATDVEPRASDFVQTCDDRLEELDDVVKREELSAMRVAGQLKIDAQFRRCRCGLWTMRQQHFDCIGGCVEERELRVALVRVATDGIRDSGEDDSRAVAFYDAMCILQKDESQLLDFAYPFARSPVVLVIPGNVEDA